MHDVPQKISRRRGFKGSIVFGLILMAVGALPAGSFLAMEKFLQPENLPTALLGIVAMGYAAVFLGVMVLAWGTVSC